MGTSRKFHTKTRNGCTNCKRRRVKVAGSLFDHRGLMLYILTHQQCNLQAPQCHHCKRRGEECSFQSKDERPAAGDNDFNKNNSENRLSIARRQRPQSQLSNTLPSQWPSLAIDHALLRWHYNALAADSLALLKEDPRRVELVWKGEVPLKSQQDPWLDSACMAISALHICHLQPPNPEDYYTAAFKNYHSAVVAFPKAVKDITPENSVAILSFSLLILMFQLGISCVPGAGPMTHALPVIDAYNAVSAMRGTWSLIDQLGPHLQRSRLSALFVHRKHLRFETLDETYETMLKTLAELNDTVVYELRYGNEREICAQAITVLRFWFSIMAAKLPTTWLLLLWWPAGVSPEFLQLLKDRNPVALVIFCHWCAGINNLPKKWYLEGWAERMLRSMLEILGPEWHFAVQWPLDEVFNNT
ncbi:hypothetical protein UA08_01806 [Talaromyces atroroseus]|uniref:Zn(2)-C6 fungal-type domain-containing protein n=1 Tax=Talaromyces atroroseus TaxID=1441469 RepID=A0A1Q5QBJ7_TALAT|nr:hypothetical protein UA08_01806 [Talaromyces atroroseus]OKL63313.1 hypothetical protein UA08_01806 [Talaromyces atroroseus]